MKKHQDLIWKLIDRSISEEELAVLQGELATNPVFRKFYQECLETEDAPWAVHACSLESRAKASPASGFRKVLTWTLGTGVGLAACLFLFFYTGSEPDTSEGVPGKETAAANFHFTPWESGQPSRNQSTLGSEIRERALFVASVTAVGGGDGNHQPTLPLPLSGGLLEVRDGWLEVTFEGSAVVRLEAPSTFEIISTSSGYLFEGNVLVSDDGDGDPFSLFHGQGKVVDVGTEFAMRVGGSDDYDIFVVDGVVDNYNGAILELERLREGDLLSAKSGNHTAVRRLQENPDWLTRGATRSSRKKPAAVEEQVTLQTATWLRGSFGTGQASGSLSGMGFRVSSTPCGNAGLIMPIKWEHHLNEIKPAETWFHAEGAAIGAKANPRGSLPPNTVTVEFQNVIEDPFLFFGWGESRVQVDLQAHEIEPGSFLRAHPSITLADGIIDFGEVPDRENIEGQAAAVQVLGRFGPENPLVFDLVSSKATDATFLFTLGLVAE